MPAPVLRGSVQPRLAPPLPARSDLAGFRESAACLGITLIPWQETAGRYLEALGADDRHLYREVPILAGRQNGKTNILLTLIHKRLLKGRRMMHTAQDRYLPRATHAILADHFWSEHGELFPSRNGRRTRPRYANGQEELRLTNGGFYRIVAPTPIGARGDSVHDVFVDELMAMDDWGFINAAKPTMSLPDPQIVYLSNMGTADSIVLQALRDRAGKDPALAYIEWSADPDRAPDDPIGWSQANPMMGYEPEGVGSVQERLEAAYRAASLDGTIADFETEYLCRWVPTTREPLATTAAWELCETTVIDEPVRPLMAVSMDPAGKRASAAIAWPQPDGGVRLRMLFDVTGDPIDADRLGKDMKAMARQLGVRGKVGFDPLTDAALAGHFGRAEPIAGSKYANASATFVRAIEGGLLRWDDCESVGLDLEWTARKPHDESGSFQAVRADDERPITAALAAIRAVWLASAPRPESATTSRPRRSTVGF